MSVSPHVEPLSSAAQQSKNSAVKSITPEVKLARRGFQLDWPMQ
jgi:hypothetical protein